MHLLLEVYDQTSLPSILPSDVSNKVDQQLKFGNTDRVYLAINLTDGVQTK